MPSPTHDEEEVGWINRAQHGDREAFSLLVQHHQRRVFSLVFHLVQRPGEVEDIAQDVFLKAFLAIRTYDFRASFSTWLARVTTNHCFDYLRHERALRVTYYSQMTPEGQRAVEARAESPDGNGRRIEREIAARDLTRKLLEQAPAEDRVILTLKELEDLSVEEISKILNLKPSTVKVRLHRARKRMLEYFRRWQGGG